MRTQYLSRSSHVRYGRAWLLIQDRDRFLQVISYHVQNQIILRLDLTIDC